MRYERLADIVRLAMRLQGAGGPTLDDIQAGFSVSRRAAERMRDAVERAFGPLEFEDAGDGRRHWRLHSNRLRELVCFSADELVELETAAGWSRACRWRRARRSRAAACWRSAI